MKFVELTLNIIILRLSPKLLGTLTRNSILSLYLCYVCIKFIKTLIDEAFILKCRNVIFF